MSDVDNRIWVRGALDAIPLVENLRKQLVSEGWHCKRRANVDVLSYVFYDKEPRKIIFRRRWKVLDGTRFLIVEIRPSGVCLQSGVCQKGYFTNCVASHGLRSVNCTFISVPKILKNIGVTNISE